jgi:hypothetical protein
MSPGKHIWLPVVALLTSAALPLQTPSAQAAEAPGEMTIRLEAVATEQAERGWGEPRQFEGRSGKARVALAGQEAVLKVRPWWNGGPRPAESEYYLIQVDYQDTATKPVVFSAFGNLSRYGDRSELHRFGGLNDGKWKTAQIPLGWDMIMARPGTGMTELSICSDSDLPVAQIRVAKLAKAELGKAAARYNAETREWIARVQAPKLDGVRNEFAEPQKPAAVVDQSNTPIVPYVRSYLQPVYPYSAPQEGEINKRLEVTMALNEYEPAAFGVYANGKDLTDVQVLVVRLEPEGNVRGKLDVTVRTAEYALVQNSRSRPRRTPVTQTTQAGSRAAATGQATPAASQRAAPANPPAAAYAVFPQRLWPGYPTQIRKGESGWFWLTFRSDPKQTEPGFYRGKAVITANQGNAVLEIRVRVLPIQLLDMNQAGLMMGGCISGLLPRHEMETMLQYNHNLINLWLSGVAPTILPRGTDDFDLDFALMDDFMAQAKAAGILANVWFLGGDPYGFPMTFTLERELAKQVLGMTNQQYAELIDKDRMNIPPQIAPLYRKWVAKVMQHAKDKDWPEQILTPFDEPAKWAQQAGRKDGNNNPNAIGTGPWIKPHFEQGCSLIHEAWPAARIYGSIHHAEPGLVFLKDIDVFCTNAIHEDPKLGDKVRAADKVFWQYSNVSNGLPDRGRYAFGFFFNAFDSRGSLCWAYNWGPRLDTTEGANWEYAWYTPLDVIPAPYYEAVREAWDDRRYVETLKKAAKDNNADVSGFLAEIAEAGRNLRGEGGRETVTDFWAASKQIGAMDEMRAKVAAKILQVSTGGNAGGSTRPAP